MKKKMNAREKREAEECRWKDAVRRQPPVPEKEERAAPPVLSCAPKPKKSLPAGSPEEEAREFLAYMARDTLPVFKDDLPVQRKKTSSAGTIMKLNLEEGMPLVKEAVSRMNTGLQEMRVSRARAVKLIHGYGSTGRGGKIRTGVRDELADMKRRKLIRDFIPGEDFGPMDADSRKPAEQDRNITRDPDYGRMNHGITIVIL